MVDALDLPDASGISGDALIAASFLADLCHRVRTPLNGILGTLELTLERDLSDASRELALAAYESAVVLHRVFEEDLQGVHDAVHDSVVG